MVCQVWPGIQKTGFSLKERTKLAKPGWGLGILVLQTDGLLCRAGYYFQLGPWRQPGNQCRRQHINQGNNREAGSRDCSPGAHPVCACVEGGAGKFGAWKNEDQDGLEPGSRGGRTQMLTGGGFRGRIKHTLWVKHQERLQTGGYERKADEPMEGSAQSAKHKNSRRSENGSVPWVLLCLAGALFLAS